MKNRATDRELRNIDVNSYAKDLPFEVLMLVYKLMVSGLSIDNAIECAKKQFSVK